MGKESLTPKEIIENWDFQEKEVKGRHGNFRPIVMSWNESDDPEIVREYNKTHCHKDDLNIIHTDKGQIWLQSKTLALQLLEQGHLLLIHEANFWLRKS